VKPNIPFAVWGTAAAFALALSASRGQDTPTFRVDVRTVYVDVFVSRGGKQVPGLTAEDFEVYDNGVEQQIELVPGGLPLSVLLLLDTSGSVPTISWSQLRDAALAFGEELGREGEIALMTFQRRAELRMDFIEAGEGRDALRAALAERGATGQTALNEALFLGLNFLEGRQGRPLALILTDGFDNASWISQDKVLRVARSSGAVVYAVRPPPLGGALLRGPFVQSEQDDEAERFLSTLSDATVGRLIQLEAQTNVLKVYSEILTEMKTRYLLVFTPEGVDAPGWHRLDVRLPNRRGLTIRARAGYEYRP
jgi:VWFA-related protein